MVVSKIKYGIEIYSNTKEHNLLILNRMLNHFKRSITMLFITTPVENLDVISGISNIEYIVSATNLATGARMMSNDGIN